VDVDVKTEKEMLVDVPAKLGWEEDELTRHGGGCVKWFLGVEGVKG
jgi:hypothetical protein